MSPWRGDTCNVGTLAWMDMFYCNICYKCNFHRVLALKHTFVIVFKSHNLLCSQMSSASFMWIKLYYYYYLVYKFIIGTQENYISFDFIGIPLLWAPQIPDLIAGLVRFSHPGKYRAVITILGKTSNSGKYQTTWEKLLKGLNLNHFCNISYCTIAIMIHVYLYISTAIHQYTFCLYFIPVMTFIKHKCII